MKNKHWLNLSAVVVLGTIFVVGCGTGTANATGQAASQKSGSSQGGKTADPVTITFYEAMSSAQGKELQKLTDAFHQQNPNINVQLVFTGSYTTQQQKLTAAIAAKKPPTMAQVEDTWETQYYDNDLLDPVQDLIPQSTIDDLMPIWKQDNSYDGKLVSVPFNKSDYILMYNTDDFKKAGISAPPKTWNELEQDAIKLTQKAGVPGLGMQADYYTFEMLMEQAGGDVLTSDNKQAAFNSQAGKDALNLMNQIANKDKAAKVISGNAYLSDGFNTNEYAMDLDTVASLSFITNKNIHFKTAPLPQGVKAAVPTAGTNLVVFNGATDAQKQAAGKYINFLISDKNTIDWAEATGYLPVRQSALKDPSWTSFIQQNPNDATGPNELSNAYFSPRIGSLSSAITEETTQVGNFMSGKQDAATTLGNMANDVNQALAGQ
ncbi:ABC transporter substrate-binding protein [Alicyclobacillus fastidiosus]|uniref:ABC transporter substrate-binding protein n=1 Tax=Alicyclobacillus fastidiosus TaxID=392011 RepID=A0ABV5AJT4_9BACL|nr:ABC transporter substrate-binding protein [Alicyclobacillus fastidiosus]WEH10131.1 ABC transporter substrate-binding protein [Alicyclobacillus fastidiosus]